tara:strand:- start:80 stop:232 length:153 start_codon:yes stop_codon:yes gene_type:complete
LERSEDKFDHKLTDGLYADRATWTINRAQDREEGEGVNKKQFEEKNPNYL